MNKITVYRNTILLIFIFLGIGSCKQDIDIQTRIIPKDNISYIDGPYVFNKNEKLRIININQHDEIIETIVNNIDSLIVKIPNQNPDHFHVKLKQNINTTPSSYQKTNKIFAVSDIEGNYYSFVNLLIGNKITDEKLNWIYGTAHLVLNGDFVDRGEYATQVLWLIYKLEQEASAAGGHVHFILGNHEAMNLEGNYKYVKEKHQRLAMNLEITKEDFFNDNNELGRWMRSKNVIERIGDVLFTHGGISKEFLKERLELEEINKIAQSNYGKRFDNDTLTTANLLFGRYGPLWYRGLVTDYRYYPKASLEKVNSFLEFYSSEKIVIGHTIIDDISTDYNDKVIRIDLYHPENKNSDVESKALLIENGIFYKVNIKGEKTEI